VKKSLIPLSIAVLSLVIGVSACEKGAETRKVANDASTGTASGSAPAAQAAAANVWRGKVVETMDVDNYTYVQLDTGKEKVWAAGPVTPMEVGRELVVSKAMPMQNFHSKALDRDFDVLYFVSSFDNPGDGMAGAAGSPAQGSGAMGGMAAMGDAASHSKVAPTEVAEVAKADGGYTVEEIFAEKAGLDGKPVKVRGQVVKFTANIMGTNWVHIQDGSAGDLTVTTGDVVAVGDIVLVEGNLTVDKDFGAGYRYEALIEDAKVVKE